VTSLQFDHLSLILPLRQEISPSTADYKQIRTHHHNSLRDGHASVLATATPSASFIAVSHFDRGCPASLLPVQPPPGLRRFTLKRILPEPFFTLSPPYVPVLLHPHNTLLGSRVFVSLSFVSSLVDVNCCLLFLYLSSVSSLFASYIFCCHCSHKSSSHSYRLFEVIHQRLDT